jgi:glyoxalase family protein
MDTLLRGIHHITLCPGRAQEDLDFFTTVLGQRLVKQTVLMDGSIPIYHFYYGNADADPGSITTSFPYGRRPGRPGSGQVAVVGYAIPHGTASFWREHFACHRAEHGEVLERFGTKYVRVRHPAGLTFEVVEAADPRRPWTTPRVGADVATRGFFGAVFSVRDVEDVEPFLIDALGMTKVGVEGAYHRFEVRGGGPASVIDLHHEPDRPAGSWWFGAGTFHHIAFDAGTDEALVAQKALYEELGYTDASELKDRFYFHSMYVRAPGGILVECTSTVPDGFCIDEAPEDLGTQLSLPPWYEEQRDTILAKLEPIRVPDANRPRPGASLRRPAHPFEKPAAPAMSRTKADFAGRGA